jgi:hypothetical protein
MVQPLGVAPLKAYTMPALIMLLCIAGALFFSCAAAQTAEPEDPVFFVIGDGATYSGGTGWYAGYVICDQSGTYTLRISANGPQSRFPVVNTKVIVCISDEARSTATITIGSNTAAPYTLTSYKAGQPSYYGASGGVFAEPDYYGYNDAYTITSLTYSQIHHPTSYYPLQVTVTFSSSATPNSKVMFLCYGIDSKGDDAKTPFSGGTLIVATPEYAVAPVAIIVCFGAYGIYVKKKSNNPSLVYFT